MKKMWRVIVQVITPEGEIIRELLYSTERIQQARRLLTTWKNKIGYETIKKYGWKVSIEYLSTAEMKEFHVV